MKKEEQETRLEMLENEIAKLEKEFELAASKLDEFKKNHFTITDYINYLEDKRVRLIAAIDQIEDEYAIRLAKETDVRIPYEEVMRKIEDAKKKMK